MADKPLILALDLGGGQDARVTGLLDLAVAGAREAGATVGILAITVPPEAGFDDEALKLAEAISAPAGLLIAIPGADVEVADFLEAAAWELQGQDRDGEGPFGRKIAGLVGVAAGRSGDLSVVEQVWDMMTEAGALVLPGAVVVDGSGGAFMDDGSPRNARHRDSAREVGASVARLIRRMGLVD